MVLLVSMLFHSRLSRSWVITELSIARTLVVGVAENAIARESMAPEVRSFGIVQEKRETPYRGTSQWLVGTSLLEARVWGAWWSLSSRTQSYSLSEA